MHKFGGREEYTAYAYVNQYPLFFHNFKQLMIANKKRLVFNIADKFTTRGRDDVTQVREFRIVRTTLPIKLTLTRLFACLNRFGKSSSSAQSCIQLSVEASQCIGTSMIQRICISITDHLHTFYILQNQSCTCIGLTSTIEDQTS